jgi:hypothetical protein
MLTPLPLLLIIPTYTSLKSNNRFMVMRYGNSSHFKIMFLWDVMPYIIEEPAASIFKNH